MPAHEQDMPRLTLWRDKMEYHKKQTAKSRCVEAEKYSNRPSDCPKDGRMVRDGHTSNGSRNCANFWPTRHIARYG